MKTIFNKLGIKLTAIKTNHFAYHFILKIGKKKFSNANTIFDKHKENIHRFVSSKIRIKFASTLITQILSKKLTTYYKLNN